MSLTVELRDRVLNIVLDRPDNLNTLSNQLVGDLIAAFDRAHADPDVWVVTLTASGTRAFSAGRDLKEVSGEDSAEEGRNTSSEQPMRGSRRNIFEVILECGKPTIAGIFGWTLGGGGELALACDIRLAAASTRIGFPEVKRGFGANFASQMLHRVCPTGAAFDLLYTGRDIGAEEAHRIHLVNEVVPDEELGERLAAYADMLAQNAPLTLRRYKAMAVKGRDLPLAAALRLESAPDPYTSEDRREGVAAFIESRPPRFNAR